MDWLTPMTGLVAGALAVPGLLLLYFLKLKRAEQVVSSTLLWRRAVRDLQVNSPFQRLRRNLLLLLQMLALLAVLVALAGPFLAMTVSSARRYVLLIDRSGSMNVMEGDETRLALAKTAAQEFVRSIHERSGFSLRQKAAEVMVIALDDHAKVMCGFTSHEGKVRAAIDAIEPGDAGTRLGEAVTIARAFAQSPGLEANNRSAETPAVLELFSDGQVLDDADLALSAGEVNYHRIGEREDNVGVVAMQARRVREQADEVEVFASLENFGAGAVSCDVQLSVNGGVRSVRSVSLGGRGREADGGQDWRRSVLFSVKGVPTGIIEVRQLRADGLASDDAAWSILSPMKKLSVLLVTEGNVVLKSALAACSPGWLDVCDVAGFADLATVGGDGHVEYDVTVLDRCVPEGLGRGRYMVFGVAPEVAGVAVRGELANQLVIDWRESHPVLQHVKMSNLFASKCYDAAWPRDAEILAEFGDGPALAMIRRERSAFLLASFDVLETNWPFDAGFVMFCYNALNYLGFEGVDGERSSLAVGEPIVGSCSGAGMRAEVSGPDGEVHELLSDGGGVVRFAGTRRVGVYRLKMEGQAEKLFAVNFLNASESVIGPLASLDVGGQVIDAGQVVEGSAGNVSLWPWLAGAALLVVCLEWLAYNSRVRL